MTTANAKIINHNGCTAVFDREDLALRVISVDGPETDRREIVLPKSWLFSHPVRPAIESVVARSEMDGNTFHQLKTRLSEHPKLGRLTINISNACNMACRYCYANEGEYYTHGLQMSRDTALNAVNFATRHFSSIQHVSFFGGEPTLNPELVRTICEYFIYLQRRSIIPHLPGFGITTNGYHLTDQMLEMLNEYRFSVSVSLDGPADIHDLLRVNKAGANTYESIARNIHRLIDSGLIPEFECTYTMEHLRHGVTLVNLMDFFFDEFQCQVLHAPMAVVASVSPWFVPLDVATHLYSDAVRYSVSNLAKGVPKVISIAARLLDSVISRTPIAYYCPAGRSLLTINADGNVFACFMLINGQGYCLGNVNDDSHTFGAPDKISKLLTDANKWQHPACEACWARPLCYGCLGEDIVRKEPPLDWSASSGVSSQCDHRRALAEAFLEAVVEESVNAHFSAHLPQT